MRCLEILFVTIKERGRTGGRRRRRRANISGWGGGGERESPLCKEEVGEAIGGGSGD